MDDTVRIIEAYGKRIQNWFTDLYNSFYNYLVNTVGENGAKMVVILGAVILVFVVYFKFQDRD